MTDLTGERPARLSVGVVGTGRVGCALARALHDAGHRVVAASGLSPASVARAREFLPGVPLHTPEGVLERADLVLLTVPDEALPELVDSFTERELWQAGQIVVHTGLDSGVDVLLPSLRAYTLPVAIHPAMHFSGTLADLDRLRGATLAVSTVPELRAVGEALVIEMGAEPVWVDPEDWPELRAALRHVSAALGQVLGEADELLIRAGVESRSRLLTSLTATWTEDVLRSGPCRAPLGDANVISADLATLHSVSAGSRAVHVALLRSQLAAAVFDGRVGTGEINELLDVLGDPRAEEAGE